MNPLVVHVQHRNEKLVMDLQDLARSHEIIRHLVQAGVRIDEVQQERLDLEDVFLQLVEEEGRGAG